MSDCENANRSSLSDYAALSRIWSVERQSRLRDLGNRVWRECRQTVERMQPRPEAVRGDVDEATIPYI